MKRGEIYWANLPDPLGRRPVVVVIRDAAIPCVKEIVVAPITTKSRDAKTEVALDTSAGLDRPSYANCLALRAVPKSALSRRPVGRLSTELVRHLDEALGYAFGLDDRPRNP